MKSAFRALGVLATGSFVSIAASLVMSKAWALLGGPEAVGRLGLFQSAVGFLVILTTVGLGTSVVRFAAQPASVGDAGTVQSIFKASWRVGGAATLVIVVLLAAVGRNIPSLVFGASASPWLLPMLIAGVVFSSAYAIVLAQLNALHDVTMLARASMFLSLSNLVATTALLMLYGPQIALVGVVIAQAAAVLFVWRVLARHELAKSKNNARRGDTTALVGFGLPYTIASLVGYGVQMLTPLLVLRLLGLHDVGIYRAATAISGSYLGFLLIALAQDYYPRLAAATTQKDTNGVINQQQQLIMMIGTPIIFLFALAAPLVVRLAYSPAFAGAATILQWQLVGDVFRFLSWTFAFGVLAKAPIWHYVLLESLGGLSFLGFTLLGIHLFGQIGLGVGFLATYAVYLPITWKILTAHVPYRPEIQTLRTLAWPAAATAIYFVSRLPMPPLPSLVVGTVALIVASVPALNFTAARIGRTGFLKRMV